MNVLYEESGSFKSGTVLADNDTSLQVEAPHGKRSKIKSSAVVLRFDAPSAAELIQQAEAYAQSLDVQFLWECCGEEEFEFTALAREYCGRAPRAEEAAGILFKLHEAPIYFHRKGRGRFRAAPAEILKAALAGQERKRQQQLQVDEWAAELEAGTLPDALKAVLPMLLYKPDRNTLEVKAVEKACESSGLSVARLMQHAGAITSTEQFHLQRFLLECFPRGEAFPALPPFPAMPELPVADVQAFSLDDAATTEIDDALSITALEPGVWRVGIHIAVPGLGIEPQSVLGQVARERLSTVYMPGRKITMLPEGAIARFSLDAGEDRPALSLYADVQEDGTVLKTHTALERLRVARNLRHHEVTAFDAAFLAGSVPEAPYAEELHRLWCIANALEARRGKPSAAGDRADYNFIVHRHGDQERIEISQRPRGTPLDKTVAELMILANSTWGRLLDDNGLAAVYRAQTGGKVRMTTTPAPHQALGTSHYAWCTSPLRRYVDLVNQWQLLALVRGDAAPFQRDETLMATVYDFDATYSSYAEFQTRMERYWTLRWLEQEGIRVAAAEVVRDNLLRLERVPLYVRLPGMPALPPGERVQVAIEAIDLLEAEVRCSLVSAAADQKTP